MTKEKGVVAIPQTYFLKMAKLDYANWSYALPREFYQNSVDAGATSIDVELDEEERVITVVDDGCGMSYGTIKEKLLVLGGSKKDKGNVGAFGKAKEILFFSWLRYEIRTRDFVVTGQGAEYTIERVGDYVKGTTCKIWVWKGEDLIDLYSSFKTVAGYFQVDCKIKCYGSAVECTKKRGMLVKDLGWASVYLDESHKSYYVSVRICGQWMFDEFLSAGNEIGRIILELNRESIQVLNSNRDSVNSDHTRRFREFINELVTETRSALDPERVIIRERFTGTGKIAVDKEKMNERLDEFIRESRNTENFDSIEEVIDGVIDRMPSENITSVDMDRVMETASRGEHWEHVDRFKFIGFQPDFHVVYDDMSDNKRKMENFMRSMIAAKLANSWTEVIKQILLDIEEYTYFNVGFDFSLKTSASYEKHEGDDYFYLNPNLLLADCKGRPRWQSNRTLLREDLILKAIHEITHKYQTSHNEAFIMKSDWIRARTWKSISIYPKIIRECFTSY